MLFSVADYFEGFLRSHMDRDLIPGYSGYSRRFCIHFRDTGRRWGLVVDAGRLVHLIEDAAADDDPRFEIDEPTFEAIVRGRLSPQRAFFARRTAIRGDLVEGLRLARILGLFFAGHPYTDGEPCRQGAET